MKLPSEVKGVLLGLLIFLVGALGFWSGKAATIADYQPVFDSYESQLEEAEVIRIKNQSLGKALTQLETDNQDLRSLIAELEARPAQIKYITKTETVIVPTDPVVITPDLPEEHLFTLKPDLTVARFAQVDEGFRFDTYELSFRNTMVVTNTKTAASLQVASSYDDEWHEIPIEVEVSEIKEQKLLEPHIGLGITAGIPSGAVMGSAYSTLIHPNTNLDILGLRLSANNQVAAVGIDPLGYNIGSQLPIFTDLWITAGPSLTSNGQWSVDLTLGSKL